MQSRIIPYINFVLFRLNSSVIPYNYLTTIILLNKLIFFFSVDLSNVQASVIPNILASVGEHSSLWGKIHKPKKVCKGRSGNRRFEMVVLNWFLMQVLFFHAKSLLWKSYAEVSPVTSMACWKWKFRLAEAVSNYEIPISDYFFMSVL